MNAHQVFRRGSKTFSLAALLFDRKMYAAATLVYGWCRYCDDFIDSAPVQSADELQKRVAELERRTRSALQGEIQTDPVFEGLQKVAREYAIPAEYPLDLIKGLEMDARRQVYPTFESLELYAYRVAGTVGLMMCHVMGVKDPRAFHHAKQMGIAMQLTNISRDIVEDAHLGRVYLPQRWLNDENLEFADLTREGSAPRVALLARRLVLLAEDYYHEGEEGLRFLRLRPALAIAAASRVYRAIGHLILKRGERAWLQRAVVPFPEKLRLIAISIWRTWRFT